MPTRQPSGKAPLGPQATRWRGVLTHHFLQFGFEDVPFDRFGDDGMGAGGLLYGDDCFNGAKFRNALRRRRPTAIIVLK